MRTVSNFVLLTAALVGCSSEVGTSTIGGSVWDGSAGSGPGIDTRTLGVDESPSDGLGPLGACVTGTVVAEARPSTLQMVVDTSGSMQWPPGWDPELAGNPPAGALSKWQITKSALGEVVDELHSDTALGLTFFPNIAHVGSSCIKNEVALPIGELGLDGSEQRDRFRRALAHVEPRGGTPTHCAFQFGTQKLTASSPEASRFLLLITDGTPTYTLSCAGDGNNPVDSSPLVADAANLRARDGVLTFVIGSAGSEPARGALSRLAKAGGTGSAGCSEDGPAYCHFDMTKETNLGAALRTALGSISKRIATCEYPIPAAPSGRALERGRVNVVYTPAGGPEEIIGRDPNGTCDDGWQYAPDGEHVVLCGQSCARVKGAAGGEVELFFGCATTPSAPR